MLKFEIMEQVIELKGDESGPRSIIIVGVHGNERCGIEAIEKLLPTLKIQKGTLYVAYGNPRAIEQNVRLTEANLNRMFKQENTLSEKEKESYEYDRARFLKTYLNKSDVLLDIHASSNPQSKIFVICEENASRIAKLLPVSLVVSGFDKVEPGGTDYYMNKIGKIGMCIECGYLADGSSVDTAEEIIISFLKIRGHIRGDLFEQPQKRIKIYELYTTKTKKFILTKPFSDFEEVVEGETIGMDGKEKILAKKNSIILFAKDRKRAGEEAFLLGEYK